ncbi:MAG: abortive infection system antitoxin AbiGi family protein [Candidatus Lokiarchaeota archaeon]|nr:abortive infection system antitoxin AbiGi family protein [Candidatus Lokiarchaeota archaeon]
MPVSSNTLFHFTNSINNIDRILTNDFIPHFSLEKIIVGNFMFEFAFPMVCFCDIPLSQIKNHIERYGQYGIGLSKEWGVNNKLNPALYIERNSDLSSYLEEVVKLIAGAPKKSEEAVGAPVLQLVKHLKQYESGDFPENYRFYDEREWRYVPQIKEIMDKGSFLKYRHDNGRTKRLDGVKLRFVPDDITYLIINDESEIEQMINKLRYIKSSKYDDKTIEKLISRIITVEQIMEDF